MEYIRKVITALALSSAVVTAGFEGYSELAYRDSAGVLTICYGETDGVYEGMQLNKKECTELLKKSIIKHSGILQELPKDTPPAVLLGSIDFIYNIGVTNFKNSTAFMYLKQGMYKKAGSSVLMWKYITTDGKKYNCSIKNNKVCYGLWKRRLWQSKAIGNWYPSVESACKASTEVNGADASVCTGLGIKWSKNAIKEVSEGDL